MCFHRSKQELKKYFSSQLRCKNIFRPSAPIQKVLFWFLRPSKKLFISWHCPFKRDPPLGRIRGRGCPWCRRWWRRIWWWSWRSGPRSTQNWNRLHCKKVYSVYTATKNPFMYFLFDLPILLQEICGPILEIYKSLTYTWMWKMGQRPRNSFSGNICFQFSVLVLCSAFSKSTFASLFEGYSSTVWTFWIPVGVLRNPKIVFIAFVNLVQIFSQSSLRFSLLQCF